MILLANLAAYDRGHLDGLEEGRGNAEAAEARAQAAEARLRAVREVVERYRRPDEPDFCWCLTRDESCFLCRIEAALGKEMS
jgi:hypothetical protein